MTIKYIPEGDKFRASQLWGEGRHQLSILKNAMSFQNLKQDQRLVHFADGTIIKCLSCFGQDVINIFVPQVFIGGEPEYREREEITYYPALEVYASPHGGSTYMGVVLCKGGGFNPPYEFIPKDSLPEDTHIKPLEKLPKERIWYPETNRMLQDIVPKGIADIELTVGADPTPLISAPGEYYGLITRVEREWWESTQYVDCWEYRSRSAAHHMYARTENLRHNYVFSYSLPGDIDPGYWPEYSFEGALHSIDKKPTNALSLTGGLYWDVQGSGGNNFYKHTAPHYYDVHAWAMKFVVDYIMFGIPFGHWERDDENVNSSSMTIDAKALSESHFAEYGNPADDTFPEFESGGAKRSVFYLGDYNYNYLDDYRGIWDQHGSVMDGDYYAVAYSMMNNKKGAHCYREISDLTKCIKLLDHDINNQCLASSRVEDITIDKQTEGPLCVAIDGFIFELFPETEPEAAPRLQHCDLRYFRVGNKSIGLFRIGRNHDDPLDYSYVYADVFGTKTNLVITPVETPTEGDVAHRIPGVVDREGNPLYEKGGLRLIKEEVIIKEMATAEQPGLFREIT